MQAVDVDSAALQSPGQFFAMHHVGKLGIVICFHTAIGLLQVNVIPGYFALCM